MASPPATGATDGARPAIAVYGDVDVNIIDGSSIWLVSLVSVLSQMDVDVHVLLKADIERGILTDSVSDLPNVRLHEPSIVLNKPRLSGDDIVAALRKLDALVRPVVLMTRGSQATKAVADSGLFDRRLWPYLTDIPQQPEAVTEEFLREMTDVFSRSGRILCQTEELRSFLVSFFPSFDQKMVLLPPMIPDRINAASDLPEDRHGLRLFYAGKFAPAWGIEELVTEVEDLRETFPNTELYVAGDKIHNPPDDPDYPARIRAALNSDGVTWLGALGRAEVLQALNAVDLAVSVRDASLDTSRELSTKLLEYAAAGVPVVANRTLMHEDLFGADYPFLVDGYDEFGQVLRSVAGHPEILDQLSSDVAEIAERHTFSAVADHLQNVLTASITNDVVSRLDGVKIGVASHDLKFAGPLLDSLKAAGAEIRIDTWLGHDRHDDQHSRDVVAWADVVIAEWCLANAVWYSNHVRPGQGLLIRLHRTEINSTWPPLLDFEKVTGVYFVGPHIREEAAARFGWPESKLHTIPNFVDALAFDRPKLPGAEFNLGMLGYLPQLKRFDLALDLVEQVRRHDPRYRLVVKGKLPWELGWVWQDLAEREYFEKQFERLRSSPLLGSSVTFERSGPEVASWFRKIGFVLSLSDVESFHLSLVEGMLSGSVPIVVERPGASQVVSPGWIHSGVEVAAPWLLTCNGEKGQDLGSAAKREAQEQYGLVTPSKAWLEAITDSVNS